MCLTSDSVKKTLLRINPRKAAGPDNIPGWVLKDCAEELKDVLTDIFNILRSQTVFPKCFKATTIIPVSKSRTHPVTRLPARCTDLHHYEVLRATGHAVHKIHSSSLPRPIPVCIQNQQVHRRCHLSCSPSSPYTPGLQRLLCANAILGF